MITTHLWLGKAERLSRSEDSCCSAISDVVIDDWLVSMLAQLSSQDLLAIVAQAHFDASVPLLHDPGNQYDPSEIFRQRCRSANKFEARLSMNTCVERMRRQGAVRSGVQVMREVTINNHQLTGTKDSCQTVQPPAGPTCTGDARPRPTNTVKSRVHLSIT